MEETCLRLFLVTIGDILMNEKPTYNELERKIKKLEKEALEYMHKEREFSQERKLADRAHKKRTLSLMRINEELNSEIKKIKSIDKEQLRQISHKLPGWIKELNFLYEISSYRGGNDFSLDGTIWGFEHLGKQCAVF